MSTPVTKKLDRLSVIDISVDDIAMSTVANRVPDDLQHLLPLTPAVFFILFALAEGEKHGYAIMQTVFRISGNQFRMGPGTLYTTIQRLLDLNLIEETRSEQHTSELQSLTNLVCRLLLEKKKTLTSFMLTKILQLH